MYDEIEVFKVMPKIEGSDLYRSGANGNLTFKLEELQEGANLKMPDGVYAGTSKEYVMDYYSGLAQEEILLVSKTKRSDILEGDINDLEPELRLREMTTVEAYQIIDGEIVQRLRPTKHTDRLTEKLSKHFPDHQILKMHNDEERKAIATQVEDLTNDKFRYGDFQHRGGFLLHPESKLIIVFPEQALKDRAAFRQAKDQFDFCSEKITFTVKQDYHDIDYYNRENNDKGLMLVDDQTYRVFEKRPDAYGDATTAILLPIDNLGANYEPITSLYEDKYSDNSIKIKMKVFDETHGFTIPVILTTVDRGRGFEYDLDVDLKTVDKLKKELSNKLNIEYDDKRIDDYIRCSIDAAEPHLVERAKHDYNYMTLEQQQDHLKIDLKETLVSEGKIITAFELRNSKGKTFYVVVDGDEVSTMNDKHLKTVVERKSFNEAHFDKNYDEIKANLADLSRADYYKNKQRVEERSLERKHKHKQVQEEPKNKGSKLRF
ncbi:DUF3945 domain-containing protein [Vibrio crassostreae]|nr:DUF3945 domain-containing protein [Vibrio crassostreae]